MGTTRKLRLVNPAPAGNRARNGDADIFSIVPLQLTTLASLSPPAWAVEIQDEIVEKLSFDGTPNLVGISVKACTSKRGYEIAQKYREMGVPVVMGGPHASLAPELVAPHCDSVIRGGVEHTWPGVLADVVSGKLAPRYEDPGTGEMPHFRLRWELLAHKPYRVYSVLATRGCPLRRTFCSIPPMYDERVRSRPVEDVLADVAAMNTRHFILWDENPTADPHYAEVLFRALGILRRVWFGEATTGVVRDARLLRIMSDSGCRALYLGVESVTQKSLNDVKKGWNRVAGYRDIVRRLADHGIAAHAGIVFGFDDDDESVFDRTVDYLGECGFNSASFKVLTPYPGTRLHAEMSARGRIVDHDMDHYDENHVVFEPRRMSRERLLEGFRGAARQFYSVPTIAARVLDGAWRRGLWNYLPLAANPGWRQAYYHDLDLR
jgi:radical SAM superfamily enzyme YgiQ (UPF0313 family)